MGVWIPMGPAPVGYFPRESLIGQMSPGVTSAKAKKIKSLTQSRFHRRWSITLCPICDQWFNAVTHTCSFTQLLNNPFGTGSTSAGSQSCPAACYKRWINKSLVTIYLSVYYLSHSHWLDELVFPLHLSHLMDSLFNILIAELVLISLK